MRLPDTRQPLLVRGTSARLLEARLLLLLLLLLLLHLLLLDLLLSLHRQHLLVFEPLLVLGHRLTWAWTLVETLRRCLVDEASLHLHPVLMLLVGVWLLVKDMLELLLRRGSTTCLLNLLRLLVKSNISMGLKTMLICAFFLIKHSFDFFLNRSEK